MLIYLFSNVAGLAKLAEREFLIILSRARAIFHSPRAIQSVVLALSLIADSFDSGYSSTTQLIRDLELHIERLEISSKSGFSQIINKTYCDLVKEDVLLGSVINMLIR
jgi:hypothetical protein